MSENNEIKEPLNKNNKVPKLRFSEFNNEWNNLRLGDILKIQNGKDQKEIEISSGVYKIYGTGGVIGYTNNFLYNKESVGIGRKGTINRPFYFNEPFWTVDTLFWCKIKENHFPKFIYYLFFTIDWNKLNQSTGVPSLTSHVIEHQKIVIPKLDEQKKIAMFFTIIDKKIDVINSKLSILKKYKEGIKKYVMKDTIKFWKTGIGNAIELKKYLIEKNEYCVKNGLYPHITLSTEGITDKSERYDRDFLVKNEDKKYKITHLNQLCYNPANLKFGVICINKYGNGIFSPIYSTFDINNITIDYLELIITSNDFINYSMKYQQGTVFERMSVSSDDLCKIKIITTSFDEQQKIAKVADTLNKKISKLEDELLSLKHLKSTLLNDMFI